MNPKEKLKTLFKLTDGLIGEIYKVRFKLINSYKGTYLSQNSIHTATILSESKVQINNKIYLKNHFCLINQHEYDLNLIENIIFLTTDLELIQINKEGYCCTNYSNSTHLIGQKPPCIVKFGNTLSRNISYKKKPNKKLINLGYFPSGNTFFYKLPYNTLSITNNTKYNNYLRFCDFGLTVINNISKDSIVKYIKFDKKAKHLSIGNKYKVYSVRTNYVILIDNSRKYAVSKKSIKLIT